MTIIARGSRLAISACAASVILAFATPEPAQAFQFKNEAGDVTGNFDTTVSLGASWRAQGRDPALVAITNGGTSRDINSDDGNLNYDKDDLYSLIAKATHELDVKYKNYGVFSRVFYFYDEAIESKGALGGGARDRLGSAVQLLDLYGRGTFDVGGRKLNLRAGKQVVSWGESTFIPNGINVINPVDVARLRGPGAELKEAFLPTGILWASQELSDRITIEGYYQTNWVKTKIDPRATFFSGNDFLSDDGDRIFVGGGRRVDQHFPPGIFALSPTAAVWAPRAADREARDGNQYGIALRLFVPELKNSEFGFYYMNYHSRTPFLSGTRGGATVGTPSGLPGGCTTPNFPVLLALAAGTFCVAPATYFADFPQDIRLFGLSFNTQGPAGIAFQGEYSYRPNQPIQLAGTEVILAAGGLANNITSNGLTGAAANAAAAAVPIGAEITGYRRVHMHQFQLTATKAFGPTFGAEQLAVVGELGYTHLNLPSNFLFSGPGVVLPAVGSSTVTTAGSTQPGMAGYATTGSYGYRLFARLDYPNAIGAVALSPRIALAHDVHGVSPTFNQGTKAATIGLGFNYKQNWQADISYTTFWGGRTFAGTDPLATGTQPRTFATSANPLEDRDFFAVSISYSF